mmetsp:Transcript_16069/g.17871  ORF Transcript_16069/g.17871 Transcript_16069/m.17871 type:complete len:133 (-) Transcript_16069:108-506(-)
MSKVESEHNKMLGFFDNKAAHFIAREMLSNTTEINAMLQKNTNNNWIHSVPPLDKNDIFWLTKTKRRQKYDLKKTVKPKGAQTNGSHVQRLRLQLDINLMKSKYFNTPKYHFIKRRRTTGQKNKSKSDIKAI